MSSRVSLFVHIIVQERHVNEDDGDIVEPSQTLKPFRNGVALTVADDEQVGLGLLEGTLRLSTGQRGADVSTGIGTNIRGIALGLRYLAKLQTDPPNTTSCRMVHAVDGEKVHGGEKLGRHHS